MKKTYLLLFGVIIFSFSVIANAEATATSLTDTSGDWDSLAIVGGTLGTNYTAWYDKSSNSSANASTNLIPQSLVGPYAINSWGSISASRDITQAKGYANTTSSLVSAKTSATSNGVPNSMAWATATSNRRGYFDMITSTALIFQIPYSYSHDISTTLPGEYASAQSWVRFDLLGDNDHDGSFDDILQWGLYGGMHNTTAHGSGQFQVGPSSMYVAWHGFDSSKGTGFVAGETYALNFRTYSESYVEGLQGDDPGNTVVPEPTTMALFGIGLLGAGVIRRKKKQ